MKYFTAILAAALLTAVCCTLSTAETVEGGNQSWYTVFVEDLESIANSPQTDGLGYTLAEEEALDQAIKKAIVDNEAPACQVAKLAVGMNFNPYSVLYSIFKFGGKIDLDQLCMCATETGDVNPEIGDVNQLLRDLNLDDVPIDKTVMKEAADAAVENEVLFPEEVADVKCLSDQGLAFTPEEGTEEIAAFVERNDPVDAAADYSP